MIHLMSYEAISIDSLWKDVQDIINQSQYEQMNIKFTMKPRVR